MFHAVMRIYQVFSEKVSFEINTRIWNLSFCHTASILFIRLYKITLARAIFKFKFSIIGFFIIGENALHRACKNNRPHQVKELLENGFDPNLLDNYGWTALHEASNFGHVASVRELLRSTGAKILSLKLWNVFLLVNSIFLVYRITDYTIKIMKLFAYLSHKFILDMFAI